LSTVSHPDVLPKRSPTMEPCTSDSCYLAPDSFKSELSKINLITKMKDEVQYSLRRQSGWVLADDGGKDLYVKCSVQRSCVRARYRTVTVKSVH